MEILADKKLERKLNEVKPDLIIDAIGMNCPAHVLVAKSKLIKMTSKQIAQFVSNDKSCLYMVPKLVKSLFGYEVMMQYEDDGKFVFLIKRDQ